MQYQRIKKGAPLKSNMFGISFNLNIFKYKMATVGRLLVEAPFNISQEWSGLASSPQTINILGPSPRHLRTLQQPPQDNRRQTTNEMLDESFRLQ